jgi:cytochrome b561
MESDLMSALGVPDAGKPDRRALETPQSYDPVLRAIHWLTAALFLPALLIGLYCSFQTPGTSPRRELLEIHKSLGMTIFCLALIRLAYRLARRNAPPLPESLGAFTRVAAACGHIALYLLMVLMPVTGYAFSSAGGYPLRWFGLFSLPRFFAGDKDLAHIGALAHGLLAYLVYATVGAHILATIWHEAVLKDGTLNRMWPRRASSR